MDRPLLLERFKLKNKIVKPEVLNSSLGVGTVLKYSFDTFEELEEFFLKALTTFNKNKSKTKVIGKSIYVFNVPNKQEEKDAVTKSN